MLCPEFSSRSPGRVRACFIASSIPIIQQDNSDTLPLSLFIQLLVFLGADLYLSSSFALEESKSTEMLSL